MKSSNKFDTVNFEDLEEVRVKALNPNIPRNEQIELLEYLTTYKKSCLKKSVHFKQPKIEAAINFLEKEVREGSVVASLKERLVIAAFLAVILFGAGSIVFSYIAANYFGW
jgi:hypothetical protein